MCVKIGNKCEALGMKDLLELRDEIDGIDREIVRLYQERLLISKQVAEYKISVGKPVFDKEREIQKLSTLSALADNDFNKHGVRELFEQIMAVSRKKQYQLLTENGIKEDIGFEQVDIMDFANAKVVFQGAAGAYTEQAMKEFFGKDCDNFHVETWRDAMEALSKGEADFAILPFENSSAGIVSEIYDLLLEYDNRIIGEHILRVSHALLGTKDAKLSDITSVFSHPQSLMQCEGYLKDRDWEKISEKNNAFAAQKVMNDNLKHQAAIAGSINADLYGLQILDNDIQDNKENYTRFIILAHKHICSKNANKLSLSFELAHESGSLYHILSHFIYNDLNMTSIQSRPVKDKPWEYRFFVEVDGNLEDSAVQNALRGIEEEASSLTILGNY